LYGEGKQLDPALGPPRPVFHYSVDVPRGWAVKHSVSMTFPDASAAWRWTGKYYVRDQNGAPDMLVDGSQVSATNVVIMSVQVVSTDITDAAGNHDPLDVVLGHGDVWVMRDGRVAHGEWIRPDDASPMTLSFHGQVIKLRPGRTWVELLPDGSLPHFG
jgi:hypothetical protein